MEVRDLNELAKEIYKANKAKGFHEEEHSYEHMKCLVISELMEAVEADRKGLRVMYHPEEDFEAHLNMEEEEFKDWFVITTKDTVEDELADAFIRLLDTAGSLGLELKTNYINELAQTFKTNIKSDIDDNNIKFTEIVYSIVFSLVNRKIIDNNVLSSISCALALIMGYCLTDNIDLRKHVELKLKYNSLRPYKHGKNY